MSKQLNRGYQYERVKHNPREAAFAEQWEKENTPCSSINFGNGILQDLFMERDSRFGFPWSVCKHQVTDGERFVAATVVQWLGSNCGMSFLEESLRKCGYRITPIDK